MRYRVWQFLCTEKMQKGKMVRRRVTVLHTKNISTPKLPNSTVQPPMGIYPPWSGCLNMRFLTNRTPSLLQRVNLWLSKR